MMSNLTWKLLMASALIAGSAQADVLYSATQGSGNTGLSATADFSVTCGTTCTLDILLKNNESGASIAIGQAISGVSFKLTTTAAGALSQTITDGSGGAVETVTDSGTIGSTNTPTHWTESLSGGLYTLTTVGVGAPFDLIIGTGTGSGTGPGFNSTHSPSFEGPVLFQITGITGLSASTDISSVSILFGTSPDTTLASTGCSAGVQGSCGSGALGFPAGTPEPVSFLLAGGGLIALACMRRRIAPEN